MSIRKLRESMKKKSLAGIMKPEMFDIQFDSPHSRYASGSLICGNMILKTTTALKIVRLTVRLLGEVHTSWVNKTSDKIYESKIPLLGEQMDLTTYLSQVGDGEQLPEGVHSIPFKFMLPPNLPSSLFNEYYGWVSYSCVGKAEVSSDSCLAAIAGTSDFVCTRPLHIVSVVNLDDFPHAKAPCTQGDSIENVGCCRSQGTVSASVSLSRSGFLVGHRLTAELDWSNSARWRNIKFTSAQSLVQQLHFRAQNRYELDLSDSKEAQATQLSAPIVDGTPLPRSFRGPISFEIPVELQPTSVASVDGNLVNISYFLRLELDSFELVLPIIIGNADLVANEDAHRRSPSILRDLLIGTTYDALLSPGLAGGATTPVDVDMVVGDISAINAAHMEYTVDMFLRLVWRDERLAYDAGLAHDDGYLRHQDKEIAAAMWWPDIYFDNSKSAIFEGMTTPNMEIRVYPNGTIYTSRRIYATLNCFMALNFYPSDIQSCPIKIMNFMSTTASVALRWAAGADTLVAVQSNQLPDFRVLRPAIVAECDGVYSTGTFSCLICTFRFRRFIGYHVFQMFLPSTAVVSVSWISFWISPRAVPARATLSITTFLALSTQASGLRVTLPAVSYATAVDVWSSICTVFVYGSLLEFALAYHLFETEENSMTTPTDNFADPKRKEKWAEKMGHKESSECAPNAAPSRVGRRKWLNSSNVDAVSRWLFPLSFVVCNLAFWTYYEFVPNAAADNLDCAAGDAACIRQVRSFYGAE